MSRIKGSPIGYKWRQRPEKSKAQLLKQLKVYLEEMRSIKPPNEGVEGVEGVDGGKLFDMRLLHGHLGFGPFESIHNFHFFLRNGIQAHPEQIPEVNELVEKHKNAQFSTCFISSTNILVRNDEIVGIVDWDTAGWYPEYWEYTAAYNVNPYDGFWRDGVGKFLREYPEACAMEQIRQKYFRPF